MLEADFRNWARQHLIELPASLTPGHRARSWLKAALANKRLVLLGEPDHFIAEKALYRENFISALWSLGVKHIAEELSFSDGHRVNAWLHQGDPAALLDLATFGADVGAANGRTDSVSGVLKASFELGPHPGFVRQARALLAMLQPLFVRDPTCSYFGFDVDYTPGGGYQDILDAAPDALLTGRDWREFTQRLEPSTGESLSEEIERLTDLQQWLQNRPQHGNDWAIISRHLQALTDGYRYIQQAYPAADYEALAPAMALRELVMHRQLVDHLHSLPDSERCVVLGHNLHLARRDDLIGPATGVNPGGDSTSSIGHHLHEVFPEQILSLWLIQGYGEDSQPLVDLPCRLDHVLNLPKCPARSRKTGGNKSELD